MGLLNRKSIHDSTPQSQGPGIVVFQLVRSSAIGRWGSRA
jgi:hypothetical protein